MPGPVPGRGAVHERFRRGDGGPASGPGRYQVRPDERFALVAPGGATPPAVNGGVMVATMLRAVLDTSPLPYPVATSAHFLRVPLLEPGEVEVTWLKQGRTAATARAALVQDAQIVLDVTVTTGSLPAEPPAGQRRMLRWTGEPPELPPIEECVNLGPWRGTVGADGTAGTRPRWTCAWIRPRPAGAAANRRASRRCAATSGCASTGTPTPTCSPWPLTRCRRWCSALAPLGWAPTVELTWHMRAVPAPGPLQVAARCRHVSGGWFDEEAEVWDAAGRLVAQGRQLARVGRSREPAAAGRDGVTVRARS